jgi:DNA-binding response OmpR family regulator
MKRISALLLTLYATLCNAQTHDIASGESSDHTIGTLLLIGVATGLLVFLTSRIVALRKKLKNSNEKLQSCIDNIHNMLTPLSLIKAPLEEILDKEALTSEGASNLNTAIRNVETMLRLANTFINTEEDNENKTLTHLGKENTSSADIPHEKHATTDFRVLIIEADEELSSHLEQSLSEQYTVQITNNGKEALEMVKEYKPDLIISDMILSSDMDGEELCTTLKNDIETSHIPIVLLIALDDKKSILKGLRTGADEYVIKPFNIDILKATLTNLLASRALLRRRYANLELNNPNECINCSTDIDWRFVDSVKKHVEDNMANPSFNVDVLCTLLNMSRTSFYNKIKALTDQAPADYARLIRLKRAAQLLKEQQHSITEVAEMTGFNDPKYFREVFKKHFKVSPSKYAKGEDPN